MEISPERQESIKTSLSLFMGEEDTERFLDYSYALTLLKEGQPLWQYLVSIGVHIADLYFFGETEVDKVILKDITDYSLEPLETLIEYLTPESAKISVAKDERDHLLFHARFALGFLLLAEGKKDCAKEILHKIAATELSVRGNEFRSGPGVLKWTSDVAMGKLQTALYLIAEYGPQEKYEELLYIMTEAIACNSSGSVLIFLAHKFLDKWATKCEKEDDSRELDFPDMNWLNVFAAAADILSLCQENDSSDALPRECKEGSAQFMAWEFGQLVARLCVHKRWRDNPFESIIGFFKDFGGVSESLELNDSSGREGTVHNSLAAAIALVSEYDPNRDLKRVRENYLSMWRASLTNQGKSLVEVGPNSDLYWAARIGFTDGIFESIQQAVVPIQTQVEPLDALRNLESIKESTSVIALRQMKQQQALDKILARLPPDTKEIQLEIEGKLGSVWRELPSKVVNSLVKAEKYYKTEVDDENAKVWLNKSVEASLIYYMIGPLLDCMQKRGYKEMPICFLPSRGVERLNSKAISKLALWEWGQALEMLIGTTVKKLSDLGTYEFREFMEMHLGGPRFPDFRSLSESLHMISKLKGGSSHYKGAEVRCDTERDELNQMRNLVLGINSTSVIVQISQLLKAKNSS